MTSSKQRSGTGDPAGEYTKRNLGETVYSFCKSFLDRNFWSEILTAKSRVKSLLLRNERELGVDTKFFGNKLVYRGFLNRRASRNI